MLRCRRRQRPPSTSRASVRHPVSAEAATVAADPIQISEFSLPRRPLKLRLALEITTCPSPAMRWRGDVDARAAARRLHRSTRGGERLDDPFAQRGEIDLARRGRDDHAHAPRDAPAPCRIAAAWRRSSSRPLVHVPMSAMSMR